MILVNPKCRLIGPHFNDRPCFTILHHRFHHTHPVSFYSSPLKTFAQDSGGEDLALFHILKSAEINTLKRKLEIPVHGYLDFYP